MATKFQWACVLPTVAAMVALMPPVWGSEMVHFTPSEDIQEQVQEAFILAKPGTTFHFGVGTYKFTAGLSLDVDDTTIRGDGMDKTIFSFSGQDAGAEGLYVTSDNVAVEDLAIEDATGNCFKSTGTDTLTLRRIRAEWTGGPKETNGAYGLYPVSSKNVLIEDCVVIGASDAGIYVGQSESIIVRRNRVEFNVAGIEIENCHGADVYENVATHNTGGILVFDLPGLPVQHGKNVRIFNNKIVDNDTPNFAPAGNIVATVPTGTGVMIMANSSVEVFKNTISGHGTTNVLLLSYLATLKPITDANYYPYPEAIHIHDNAFGDCGAAPAGESGALIARIGGSPLPDVVWDGVVNREKYADGSLPADRAIVISKNTKEGGEVGFVNLNLMEVLGDPQNASVKRDLSAHDGELPSLKAITLKQGVEK